MRDPFYRLILLRRRYLADDRYWLAAGVLLACAGLVHAASDEVVGTVLFGVLLGAGFTVLLVGVRRKLGSKRQTTRLDRIPPAGDRSDRPDRRACRLQRRQSRLARHGAEAPNPIPAGRALRNQWLRPAFWRRFAIGLLPTVLVIEISFVVAPSVAPAIAAGACAFIGAWAVEVARGEQRREQIASGASARARAPGDDEGRR